MTSNAFTCILSVWFQKAIFPISSTNYTAFPSMSLQSHALVMKCFQTEFTLFNNNSVMNVKFVKHFVHNVYKICLTFIVHDVAVTPHVADSARAQQFVIP